MTQAEGGPDLRALDCDFVEKDSIANTLPIARPMCGVQVRNGMVKSELAFDCQDGKS